MTCRSSVCSSSVDRCGYVGSVQLAQAPVSDLLNQSGLCPLAL